jgi:hypothetical protein
VTLTVAICRPLLLLSSAASPPYAQSRHLDSQLAKPSCDDAYFKERVHELFRMINELMIHGSAAADGQVCRRRDADMHAHT